MPAKFINVNNSGRANFRNVNNSGRAIFGDVSIGPLTTTTTSTTTTTTTTGVPTYPRWSVTACPGSTQGPTVVATSLTPGSVYSGPNGCFTVNSAFGTSTDLPGTYTEVTDCGDARCPQQ